MADQCISDDLFTTDRQRIPYLKGEAKNRSCSHFPLLKVRKIFHRFDTSCLIPDSRDLQIEEVVVEEGHVAELKCDYVFSLYPTDVYWMTPHHRRITHHTSGDRLCLVLK